MKLFKWGPFRVKVTVILILALFLIAALSDFIITNFALTMQFNQIREKLKLVAGVSSLMIEPELLQQVPLTRESVDTPQFKAVAGILNNIKAQDPTIKYIYTLAKTDQDNILQFIVDPEPFSGEVTSLPGDKYDASRCPDMLMGFKHPSADRQLMKDAWGITLSGYAPIKDKSGKSVAVLGVDIAAKDIYNLQKEIYQRMVIVLLICVFFAVILGLVISTGITDPLRRLVEGTRRISYGDLLYRVAIKGKDEMAELARSFNNMAQVLLEWREDLRGYFFRVV